MARVAINHRITLLPFKNNDMPDAAGFEGFHPFERRSWAASLRTWASVILCKSLIGTLGSSLRYSTQTTRPPGFNARQMESIISIGMIKFVIDDPP